MIDIPVDIRCLEGFDLYDVLLPSNRQESRELILQFSTIGRFLDYQENLLTSLKDIRSNDSLTFDLGMQHKTAFIEKILTAMMSSAVAIILSNN